MIPIDTHTLTDSSAFGVKNGIIRLNDDQNIQYEEWKRRIGNAFGTEDMDVAAYLLNSLCKVSGIKTEQADVLNGLCAAIQELHPRDHCERMLVSQMVLVDYRLKACMHSAGRALSPEMRDTEMAMAVRLMRLYTQQLETLRRYRTGGNQMITVNHVTAEQAIVGDVYKE